MFRNNKIQSREDFKAYCLRALGSPVVSINVADEQVEDRIDDALDKFWEFHLDGSVNLPVKIQVTQEMLDTGIVPLPISVITVKSVYSAGYAGNLAINNLQYRQFITELLDLRNTSGGLSQYVQGVSYLGTINQLVGTGYATPIEFNTHRNQLQLVAGFQRDVQVDDWIVIDAYIAQDMDEFKATWNNQWLKQYATALIKYQWGVNLTKFNNAPMPGGITLNGAEILQEAKDMIQKLEEELADKWQDPPMFFMA